MPNYRYTARDERGAPVTGTLAASNPEALADQLKRMGYLVTQSRELAESGTLEALLSAGFKRVSFDDLALFNVQLSKMVQVGIPLVTGLNILAQQAENSRLQEAARAVAIRVEGGASFSEALERHPAIFSELFINMIRAGETSGRLDEVLKHLADFAERQASLHEQLKTALVYPCMLLVVGIAIMIFLVTGIIPKFMDIFLQAQVPLPLPTEVLYRIGQAVRFYWPLLLGGLGLAIWLIRWYLNTPKGRRRLDRLLLKCPVVEGIVRKVAVSRFARTLQMLLKSGVPILESLSISGKTCGNVVISDVVNLAERSVKEGGTLSRPLKGNPEFPPMVAQMMVVAEASGTMEVMLGEIADHYDTLVAHGVRRASALVEPIFLGGMGGMVAFIMASVLLPLFRMVNVIK